MNIEASLQVISFFLQQVDTVQAVQSVKETGQDAIGTSVGVVLALGFMKLAEKIVDKMGNKTEPTEDRRRHDVVVKAIEEGTKRTVEAISDLGDQLVDKFNDHFNLEAERRANSVDKILSEIRHQIKGTGT